MKSRKARWNPSNTRMKSALQMKLNPSLLPTKSDFITKWFHPTKAGFIPSDRTDLVEKKHPLSGRQRVFLFWRYLPILIQNLGGGAFCLIFGGAGCKMSFFDPRGVKCKNRVIFTPRLCTDQGAVCTFSTSPLCINAVYFHWWYRGSASAWT